MSNPVIVINQKIVEANLRDGRTDPVFSVSDNQGTGDYSEVIIMGQDGRPAAKLHFDPDLPLLCGCHCWVEVIGGYSAISTPDPRPRESPAEPCKDCGKKKVAT